MRDTSFLRSSFVFQFLLAYFNLALGNSLVDCFVLFTEDNIFKKKILREEVMWNTVFKYFFVAKKSLTYFNMAFENSLVHYSVLFTKDDT